MEPDLTAMTEAERIWIWGASVMFCQALACGGREGRRCAREVARHVLACAPAELMAGGVRSFWKSASVVKTVHAGRGLVNTIASAYVYDPNGNPCSPSTGLTCALVALLVASGARDAHVPLYCTAGRASECELEAMVPGVAFWANFKRERRLRAWGATG